MKRNFIRQPLILAGNSFLGLQTILEIKPISKQGIWWKTLSGKKILIKDALFGVNKLLHFLTIRYEDEVLNIPEHLFGLFFAIGLDGVCIVPQKSRLPYDGCAKMFLDIIKSSVCKTDDGLSLYTPKEIVEIGGGVERSIQFIPDMEATTLMYQIGIDYEDVGACILEGDMYTLNVEELASSRPYGRTRLHKKISEIFQREGQYVWFEPKDNKEVLNFKLKEIALHRLLDLLGALMYACPPGGRLVGKIVTKPFSGHATDMLLLNELKNIGLREIS